MIAKTLYRQRQFAIILKLDGQIVHCDVVTHKGQGYASCDSDALGTMTFDKDGKLLASTVEDTTTP